MRTKPLRDTIDFYITKVPPPIYHRAERAFGVRYFRDDVVMTYGNTIHLHRPNILTDDVIEHECVHMKQQALIGEIDWWEKYFADENFRMEQELEAYRHQYAYILDHFPKHMHSHRLDFLADSFARIYGLKGMTVEQAKAEIQKLPG